MKLKGPAMDMLSVVSEAVGPKFVVTHLHKKAAAHKNPKVRNPEGGVGAEGGWKRRDGGDGAWWVAEVEREEGSHPVDLFLSPAFL
jgi:hypothetical protein